MKRDVIIACDFNSKEELVRFLERFGEESIQKAVYLVEVFDR